MRIWICGIAGYMGRAVAEEARKQDIAVAGGIDRAAAEMPFPVYTGFSDLPDDGDVLIDFSSPAALADILAFCTCRGMPAVLCTTGYTEEQLRQIDEAARQIPVFRSGNMSVGIALLRRLASQAAQVLGPGFDVEITETHHRRKKDAPSGTALMLFHAIEEARGDVETKAVCGRSGTESRRTPGEIGIHALRGGTVVGEHEVAFLGDQERIRLSHSAESRSVFALGALRAASFLMGREPGLYDMDDMLSALL